MKFGKKFLVGWFLFCLTTMSYAQNSCCSVTKSNDEVWCYRNLTENQCAAKSGSFLPFPCSAVTVPFCDKLLLKGIELKAEVGLALPLPNVSLTLTVEEMDNTARFAILRARLLNPNTENEGYSDIDVVPGCVFSYEAPEYKCEDKKVPYAGIYSYWVMETEYSGRTIHYPSQEVRVEIK